MRVLRSSVDEKYDPGRNRTSSAMKYTGHGVRMGILIYLPIKDNVIPNPCTDQRSENRGNWAQSGNPPALIVL